MFLESSLTNDQALEECIALDGSTEVNEWRLTDNRSFSYIYPLLRNFYATYLRLKYPIPLPAFSSLISDVPARTHLRFLVNQRNCNRTSEGLTNLTRTSESSEAVFITSDLRATHAMEFLHRSRLWNKQICALEWLSIQQIPLDQNYIIQDGMHGLYTDQIAIEKLGSLNSYLARRIDRQLNFAWIQSYLNSIITNFIWLHKYLEKKPTSIVYYDDFTEPRSIALRITCQYYGIKTIEVVHGSVFEHKYTYKLPPLANTLTISFNYYPDVFLTLSTLEQQASLIIHPSYANISHRILALPPTHTHTHTQLLHNSSGKLDILILLGKAISPTDKLENQNRDEMHRLLSTLNGFYHLHPNIGLKLHPHSSPDNIQFHMATQYMRLKKTKIHLIDCACDLRHISAKYVIPLGETTAWKHFEDRPDVKIIFFRNTATYQLITQANSNFKIFTSSHDAIEEICDDLQPNVASFDLAIGE